MAFTYNKNITFATNLTFFYIVSTIFMTTPTYLNKSNRTTENNKNNVTVLYCRVL